MSLHHQSFHTQSIYSRFLYRKPVCSRPHFFLALGGLLALAISTPALAQSVDIDADGSVRVDAGEGTVIEAGAAGTGVRTNGAAIEASGQVNNTRVNAGGDGVVHVIGTGGGRATTTINGRTITSSTESGGAASYANQDLAGNNFAGMRLEGATFANSALQGASFRDAILIGTSFANANLDSVDFRGANLQNATLTNAVLSGARFDGAIWIDGRVCGSGSVGNCR